MELDDLQAAVIADCESESSWIPVQSTRGAWSWRGRNRSTESLYSLENRIGRAVCERPESLFFDSGYAAQNHARA